MSIGVSAAATPSRDRSKETVDALNREKRWDKDMPAYKRLREDGLQPPHIDGAHRLESESNDKLEIQAGKKIADGTLEVIKEIRDINGAAS